jgi:MFS family permease
VLAVLSATQCLVVIDGVPVAVALPSIGDEFAHRTSELQWVVNGYVLALVGGLLLFGRCADLFGRRRVLLFGLSILTAATLLAGLAPTGPLLVMARVAQGLGAAMVLPASLALVPALFGGGARRDHVFAIMALVQSAAWIVGAVGGGLVADLLGWRFVFLVTLPVGIWTFLVARQVLPESRDDSGERRVDVVGAVTMSLGLTVLVFGVVRVDQVGLWSVPVLGAMVAGAVLLGVFMLVERRVAYPLIAPGLFRIRRLWGASLGVAANTAAYTAVVFVGTLYLQEVRGFSPATIGLFFLPLAVGAFLSPVLARLLGRSGPRPFAIGGLLVCAVALAALAWCASVPDAHPAGIVLALLVFGIAQYAAWLALVGQATADVEPRRYGVAFGVFKTSTHVGAAVAVAVFATTIDVLGGEATGGGPYAAAYLVGAGLAASGAVSSGLLIRSPSGRLRGRP